MKKIFIIFISLFLLASMALGANSCEYTGEIDKCFKAIKNGKNGSIEDFECISNPNNQFLIMQIVLDKQFRKTDEKMEKFIYDLEQGKGKYFSGETSYIEGINDIYDKFSINGEFWKEYQAYCAMSGEKSIMIKTESCVNEKLEGQKIDSTMIRDFIQVGSENKTNLCMQMAEQKLAIYKNDSLNVLKLNYAQIRKDKKKEVQIERRGKYNALLDKIIINIKYLDTIRRGWPSKTKKPIQ